MQNEPNSGGSRAGHRRAGHAGSWQADKLGPVRIRQPRPARNGMGGPGNWTTRVRQVPPVADGGWRRPGAGGGSMADDQSEVESLERSRKPLEKSYPARIRTWKNRTKTCCDTVSPPGNRVCSLATRCASGKTTRRRKRRFGSSGPCTQGSRAERSDPRPRH